MALIKKADVPQYFAARRAMKLGTLRSGNQRLYSGAQTAKTADTDANTAKFKRDFSSEHSTPPASSKG